MVKQISIGFREDQLNDLARIAGEQQISQAEVVRRLVDDARRNRQRLIDLSRAFIRGHITDDEFAGEVSVIILSPN